MLGKEPIWEQVELFRKKYPATSACLLPVDILTLAEVDLELDIIPFDDLFPKYGVDAALVQDFTALYVDAESYILWEKGPEWKQSRLRFSISHELGHYVLHRQIASQQNFQSFEQFFEWTRTYGGNKYSLEQAANEFAGRLLVPLDRLQVHFAELAKGVKQAFPNWRSSVEFLRYFSAQVSPIYGVSAKVIEVRLEREGLWIIS